MATDRNTAAELASRCCRLTAAEIERALESIEGLVSSVGTMLVRAGRAPDGAQIWRVVRVTDHEPGHA
jgi:hypothetical protein